MFVFVFSWLSRGMTKCSLCIVSSAIWSTTERRNIAFLVLQKETTISYFQFHFSASLSTCNLIFKDNRFVFPSVHFTRTKLENDYNKKHYETNYFPNILKLQMRNTFREFVSSTTTLCFYWTAISLMDSFWVLSTNNTKKTQHSTNWLFSSWDPPQCWLEKALTITGIKYGFVNVREEQKYSFL